MMKYRNIEPTEVDKHELFKPEVFINMRFSWKRQLSYYRNHIEAVICFLSSVLVAIISVQICIENDPISKKITFIYMLGFIISLYALVKGIFTLIFAIEKNRLHESVSKYALILLKNELYHIYERFLWLWVLAPICLIVIFFIMAYHFELSAKEQMIIGLITFTAYLTISTLINQKLKHKKENLIQAEIEIKVNKPCEE